jgi:hypothetical protein
MLAQVLTAQVYGGSIVLDEDIVLPDGAQVAVLVTGVLPLQLLDLEDEDEPDPSWDVFDDEVSTVEELLHRLGG